MYLIIRVRILTEYHHHVVVLIATKGGGVTIRFVI